MKEVIIQSQNEINIEEWPPIHYFPYMGRWCAQMVVTHNLFSIDKCDSPEEAVARIEQSVVETLAIGGQLEERRKNPINIDRRNHKMGRRDYDQCEHESDINSYPYCFHCGFKIYG